MSDNSSIHNSKLFVLLRALNKKELKQFNLWLSSPFLNNSEKVLNLYRGLIKTHKKLNSPIDKHQLMVYAKIKENSKGTIHPKDDLLLRQTMSALNKQIQDFLIWQKNKEDKALEKRRLMDALIERKLYKLIPAVLAKTQKELDNSPYRNMEYYENRFLMREMEFYLNIILNNRDTKTDIQQVIDALWQTQLNRTLKYYCAGKSREIIVKDSYDYPMINSIKEFIQNSPNKDIPIIKVHYILLNLIEKEKDEYFYELKNYLFKYINIFDAILARQFLNHLTNYCIRAIRLGKNQFEKEQYDVYKLGLRLNCWSIGIVFPNAQFISIARNALRMGEIDWANAFVKQYKSELHPDTQEDIINYYYALAAFQLKQYSISQDHLSKIASPEDFVYHLRFKVLLIKIYYEQEPLTVDNVDIHPINYELEAIRHYVISTRNKKMSESLRDSYNNFVNLLKRIIHRKKKMLWNEKVKGSIDKLTQELDKESPFVERQWLREKIEELKTQKHGRFVS